MKNNWKIWDMDTTYGDTFFLRATGNMPEMESSKAIAKRIKKYVRKNDSILDIGCGGGHYLVSLDKALEVNFSYTGVDATPYYIKKAKEAFCSGKSPKNPHRTSTEFIVGDIFNIPLEDNHSDLVACSNVLLHLPSVEKSIRELIRVSKKYVIIRTLIGNTSFRIKHIKEPEKYNEDGEPEKFYFFNIYSEKYIQELIGSIKGVRSFSLEKDQDFNPDNIGTKEYKDSKKEVPFNVTTVVNGMQLNNYIIQPWQFLVIEKKA